MELTPEEGRVLGALVEKELTTPQGYPLTDNALLAACNQTTSRDPVVSYDVAALRIAVRSLREQGLLRTVHRTGERSDKHRHELPAALELSREQVVVLAVLLLRGAQTAAELRARSERMHVFGATEDVERVLAELASRDEPLTRRLERQPGRKEPRWVQLLAAGGVPGDAAPAGAPARPPAEVADALLRAVATAARAGDAARLVAPDVVVVSPVAGPARGVDAVVAALGPDPQWAGVSASGQGGVVWFVARGGNDGSQLSGVLAERAGRHVLVQLHVSRPG